MSRHWWRPALVSDRDAYRRPMYATYASDFQGASERFDPAAAERWGRTYHRYLTPYLPRDRSAAILDAGCGAGMLLHLLSGLGYQSLTGVDISAEQVALARQVVPDVSEGNALKHLRSYGQHYDLIFALDVLEHLYKDEILEFLDACFAALRPGGRIVLQTPNADSPWVSTVRYGDFTHELAFNRKSLAALLRRAGFTGVEAKELGPIARGHSVASSIRAVAWQAIRGGMMLWNLVETGHSGSGILTRNFLMTGRRPRH